MPLYHNTPDGPRPCRAHKGLCPYGREGGEHYTTREAAAGAYESSMALLHSTPTFTSPKRSFLSKLGVRPRPELNGKFPIEGERSKLPRRAVAVTMFLAVGATLTACQTGANSPVANGPASRTPVSTVQTESTIQKVRDRLNDVKGKLEAAAHGTPSSASPLPSLSGSAASTLAQLPVKTLPSGSPSSQGYSRTTDFGTAWTDSNTDPDGHNGCDTRNDVLRRDLTDIVYKSGDCEIATGTLYDPYTGQSMNFVRGVKTSGAVQIDHVLPLGLAFQEGAKNWSQAKRVNLANDPLNLLAVDGPQNESKSDDDAGSYLPPNKAFDCRYVAIQITVSKKYGLPVSPQAKSAMQQVLATCPGQSLAQEPGGQK